LLIDSAPDPDRVARTNGAALGEDGAQAEEVEEGTGEVASLIHPPSGCRFNPRCPHAMDVCRLEVPPKFDVGRPEAKHWAACWLYGPDEHKTGDGSASASGAAA